MPTSRSASFTETIRRLEQEKQGLAVDLERARNHSEDFLRKQGEWQARTYSLQAELEEYKASVIQLERELDRVKNGTIVAIRALQNSQESKDDEVFPRGKDEVSDTPSCG